MATLPSLLQTNFGVWHLDQWGAAWLPGVHYRLLPPRSEGEQSEQLLGSVMFWQEFLSLFPSLPFSSWEERGPLWLCALLADLVGRLCVCSEEELVSENWLNQIHENCTSLHAFSLLARHGGTHL